MEQSFIMVKPEGVKRRLVGKIISTFEEKGLFLVDLKVMIPSKEILETHYVHLKDKPFFGELVDGMRSGNVVGMIWAGKDAVKICRTLIGATNPLEAAVGTIRGKYGVATGKNIVHGSDSVENAKKEIELWFEGKANKEVIFNEDLHY